MVPWIKPSDEAKLDVTERVGSVLSASSHPCDCLA